MKPIIIEKINENTELNKIQISMGDSFLTDINNNNISDEVRSKISAVSQEYLDSIVGNIITAIDNL